VLCLAALAGVRWLSILYMSAAMSKLWILVRCSCCRRWRYTGPPDRSGSPQLQTLRSSPLN